jgi:hypothetical protein
LSPNLLKLKWGAEDFLKVQGVKMKNIRYF